MDKPIPEGVAWPFSILEAGNWREVYMGTKHMRLEVSYPYEAWERLMATLTAAQPHAEAHCATCSCVPGMTPAVRFNTTPAEHDGAVRDHLIRMGWTPPAEAHAECAETLERAAAQQQGGGEDLVEAEGEVYARREVEPEILHEFRPFTAPPSAPVGVVAPGSRAWMAEVCRAAALSLAAHGVRNDQLSKVADWIAQHPAAEFHNDGNTEADFIAHEANACTACGGSGHKADQQPAAVDGKYAELIYAVARKYPGESRHETALRYIRQAESADHGPAQAATQHQEPTT